MMLLRWSIMCASELSTPPYYFSELHQLEGITIDFPTALLLSDHQQHLISGQLSAVPDMSVARLSPTANLLRNSKLFALPPALSLPPARPTAEPTATSDTATTLYPIKAALETPTSSLHVGDWGLKRALP